eukprot:6726240-Prymnesium_polylepis.2
MRPRPDGVGSESWAARNGLRSTATSASSQRTSDTPVAPRAMCISSQRGHVSRTKLDFPNVAVSDAGNGTHEIGNDTGSLDEHTAT